MINELKKLGFTNNEINVYSAILDLGQSSTGPIIKKTGLHRNIVYDVLDTLVKRKLLSESIKSGKKYFKIKNPQILILKAQEQLEASNKLAGYIKNKLKSKAPEVIIYEGKEGWESAYRLLKNRLKAKETVCTLGVGGDKWISAMGDFFITWENFLVKHKIMNKMIAYKWQKKEIEAHQKNPMRKTKYLPEPYSISSNTEIFKDGIFIQIYSDPIILIEIRSKEIAKGYQQHFDVMWKLSKY